MNEAQQYVSKTSSQHWFYEEWVKGFRPQPTDKTAHAIAIAMNANAKVKKLSAEKLPMGAGNERLAPLEMAVR